MFTLPKGMVAETQTNFRCIRVADIYHALKWLPI